MALSWARRFGAEMGIKTIRTRHGFLFNSHLDDWLGQYVYINGVYEPPTANLFTLLIKPGSTVLDIGANAGFFSLLSSVLVGAEGKVYAFEPIPSVRNRLTVNINLNKFSNIEVIAKAASDNNAFATIHEGPEDHKGISSLRPLKNASQSITIETIAIDTIATDIGKIDFVKIDIEGAELLALTGMERIIEQDHPTLVIEFTDAYLQSFGHSATKMADWLTQYGYRLFIIEDRGLIPLTKTHMETMPQYNVLACQALTPKLLNMITT
jgi:FkbM family methyltransferase